MFRYPSFKLLLATVLVFSLSFVSCSSNSGSATVFEVRIENLSTGPIGTASNGAPVFAFLAPGIFLVHTSSAPAYSVGEALPANGFEAYAEDSDIGPLLDALRFVDDISLIGFFDDLGDGEAGFLGPQQSFRFVISASDTSDKLSVFLKYLESNDVFLGTSTEGIALFDAGGNPISGDITASFALYDAGTEVNEEPAVGPNQPLRQPELNTGPPEGGLVRPVDDGFAYPGVGATFRITITPIADVDTA